MRRNDTVVQLRPTVWVCGACGKTGPARDKVGDESCYLNSVECFEESIERDERGRVRKATAVPT